MVNCARDGLQPVACRQTGRHANAWLARSIHGARRGVRPFARRVLGGYLGRWSWTGFTGNTLWDWLHLLLLPLLLPTVIVPALSPLAMARVTTAGDEKGATASTAVEVAPPVA